MSNSLKEKLSYIFHHFLKKFLLATAFKSAHNENSKTANRFHVDLETREGTCFQDTSGRW